MTSLRDLKRTGTLNKPLERKITSRNNYSKKMMKNSSDIDNQISSAKHKIRPARNESSPLLRFEADTSISIVSNDSDFKRKEIVSNRTVWITSLGGIPKSSRKWSERVLQKMNKLSK